MKILVVGTYPISTPQHGGQKRVEAIIKAYKTIATVKYIAVFHKRNYHDYSKYDIALGREFSLLADANPLTGDIICGRAAYEDPKVKADLARAINSFSPDIIHIEQPYMYLGLKKILVEIKMKPKIIFGSQNVEGPMKREILKNSGYDQSYIDEAVKIIDDTETELARNAVLTVACTREDIDVHMKQGATETVLAMNGIAPISTNKASIEFWQNKFSSMGIKKTALFVASAHPPSIKGFDDMIGRGLGFLKHNERLIIAGGISDYYAESIKDTNIDLGDATFWLRALACGRLSESSLGALLRNCDVIILPITEGGGSNLKTAEAIATGKKIVTTPHALRSFEWLNDFPNVWVVEDQTNFHGAIREALDAELIERNKAQNDLVETVYWDFRLKDLVKKVSKL